MFSRRHWGIYAAGCMVAAAWASPVLAKSVASPRENVRVAVDLPRQPLSTSIRAVATLTRATVLVDEASVRGIDAPPLRGRYDIEAALNRLLSGSGLVVRRTGEGFAIVHADALAPESPQSEGIVVTGSRIRGAPIASPVITLDQQDLRDTGYADLGEVARSLPQSFGGGQNPGLGLNVPQSVGANVSGGSSLNLRGLGADATLTLLNGRRMAYDGALQGVDISAIPMAAVERLEVVADGASAIYGADAIGGVVNVILRDDFDGVATRARIAAPTGGGDFQQLYGAMAGSRWRGGGGFIAYEYNRNSELNSSDRSSTRNRPNLTLLPASHRNALVGHVHQNLTDTLRVEIDGHYNDRAIALAYPLDSSADLAVSRAEQGTKSHSFSLAAAAKLDLGPWRLSLSGTYGNGRNAISADYYYSDVLAASATNQYDNRSVSAELAADGTVVTLPAGEVRLAAGVGLRTNGFKNILAAGSDLNIDATQRSRYVFGELSIPLVSSEMAMPLVRSLDLSVAARYEDYAWIGDIVTPKLGLVYAPNRTLELRASWGKSFRAPSFYDQYGLQQGILYPAASLGGTGYPSGAGVLMLTGGNVGLKPERATSWSATIAIHPPALAGASLEISYFSTRYRDRIVNPVTLTAQALSNPIYASQVTLDPTSTQVDAAIARTDVFYNYVADTYDPASVIAIVDSTNINAGRQDVRGLDIQARYRHTVASATISAVAGLTYLKSDQQISATHPTEILAGNLFSPPHWRGRASLFWEQGPVRLGGTVSYIGGITDTSATPVRGVRGMTTLDLSARYKPALAAGVLRGVELGLAVENLFNTMPGAISTTSYFQTPFDTTNYSAVGRVIAFEVTKAW